MSLKDIRKVHAEAKRELARAKKAHARELRESRAGVRAALRELKRGRGEFVGVAVAHWRATIAARRAMLERHKRERLELAERIARARAALAQRRLDWPAARDAAIGGARSAADLELEKVRAQIAHESAELELVNAEGEAEIILRGLRGPVAKKAPAKKAPVKKVRALHPKVAAKVAPVKTEAKPATYQPRTTKLKAAKRRKVAAAVKARRAQAPAKKAPKKTAPKVIAKRSPAPKVIAKRSPAPKTTPRKKPAAPRVQSESAKVLAVVRALSKKDPLVYVPAVSRSKALAALSPFDTRRILGELQRAGKIELRPESGIGLLSKADERLCPAGPQNTVLSYARLLTTPRKRA